MKKVLLIILSSLIAATSMFASGAQDKKPEGPVEVEFWTMQLSPTFDGYINGTIAAFEAENPDIKVKWVDVPWGDMETRILTAAASGGMPDIANMNPHFAQKLAQLDALVDMEKMAGDVKSLYFRGSWDANKFGGKTFALPWYLTTPVLFYNKALFEEAGLDPENPPKTYEEVFAYAEKITAATGKYGYMPVLSDHAAMEEMEKAGIRLFNNDFTKAQFAKKEIVDAVNLYKNLIDRKIIPTQALSEGTGTAIQMFSAGEVAMFNGGTSHAGMIKNNSEDVYGVTGIGAQPIGSNGKTNVAVMNIAVAASSKYPEESVKFAKFITNGANQVEFSMAAGAIVPSIAGAETSDFFTVSDGTAVADARIISAAQVKNAQVIFPPMQNFTDIKDAFLNALQRSLLEDGDIMNNFVTAEAEANAALME
jgi:putative chitobiose transport system substrate-binding protein